MAEYEEAQPEVVSLTELEKGPEVAKEKDPYDPEPYKKDAISSLDTQLEALRKAASEVEVETPEQKKKRERSERAQKIIGAVTDGLSSMANLYFTTQYAPSMYKKENSMQEKQNATFEKLKAEREANREKALAYALKIGEKEAETAKTIREIEEGMERRRQAHEKAKQAADLHPYNVGIKEEQWRKEGSLADKAGYDAEKSRLVSENMPQEFADKHELNNERILTEQVKQRKGGGGGQMRRGVAEYMGMGKDGEYHPFQNRQAAIDFERREGTYDASRWEYDEQTTKRKENNNRVVSKTKKAVVSPSASQDSEQVKGQNTRKLGL